MNTASYAVAPDQFMHVTVTSNGPGLYADALESFAIGHATPFLALGGTCLLRHCRGGAGLSAVAC